jgi:hypothetical protein
MARVIKIGCNITINNYYNHSYVKSERCIFVFTLIGIMHYYLSLYKEVMCKMKQKMSNLELYEGYHDIYESKMMRRVDGMQEKKWDRGR